jgi:hypothetical protein
VLTENALTDTKDLLEEMKACLENEGSISIVHHITNCPNIAAEFEKCPDKVLLSCCTRAMRFPYLPQCSSSAVRGVVAPGNMKTDDTKTPRTRAAGIPSFKLNYKNREALELAEDGRGQIYNKKLAEKNKDVSGDVDGSIKTLFELFDTGKTGKITWPQFQEVDRLITETLGGQYSEMISRRIYSMMLYPGLTLESDISYATFYNYHSFIAKSMGNLDGDKDVGIHYKYTVDKFRHMRKGKRFQKNFDLFITHDRSKDAKRLEQLCALPFAAPLLTSV